jgi:glycosyltransferase involved in cell wall biosynthesis
MKILFIHQNFPSQFAYLAPALAIRGHEVTALRLFGQDMSGVKGIVYQTERGSTPGIHPWVMDFETQVIRGEAVLKRVMELKANGYVPDVIVAHHGWGETLFIKEVWPETPLGIYCEFYYRARGGDLDFDPEFYVEDGFASAMIGLKNMTNRLHFEFADAGIAPTAWQKNSFPQPFRERISVIHEGVDTNLFKPNSEAALVLNQQVGLRCGDELITFVNRNLEPPRGFHSFMRALPKIQAERPNARILIVGGEGVSYGAQPPNGESWKTIFLRELDGQLDLSRIHFLGNVSYPIFLTLMQVSMVHIYLTYPFVLSWSCIEAMSAGCAIVSSDTAPVREVITNNQTGRLVDFFSPTEIATQVIDLIENKSERERLGLAARQFAIDNFDRQTVCLPKQISWVERKFI